MTLGTAGFSSKKAFGQLVFYSIGHSNHPIAHFLDLMRMHEIEALADVRSVPFSRHAPQFGRHVLEQILGEAEIEYTYFGRELGGRPDDPSNYDASGHVLYGRLAKTTAFQAGIQRLVELGDLRNTAVMCAEEDPGRCHRHLLIGRVLEGRGAEIRHIRKDGRIGGPNQPRRLLEEEVEWRSPGPIQRPAPQARTGLRGRPAAS